VFISSVRFFKPSFYEAKKEAIEFVKDEKIDIDENALSHLVLLLDNDLELILAEIGKLSLRNSTIGTKEIDDLVYPLTTVNLERFFHELLSKKPVVSILKKIEEETNEIQILVGLQNYVQQLFMFHSFVKISGRFDSREVLGYRLPPAIERERLSLALKIKEIYRHSQKQKSESRKRKKNLIPYIQPQFHFFRRIKLKSGNVFRTEKFSTRAEMKLYISPSTET